MPPRLSELLERIRPAGTPGAPTEGEQPHQEAIYARELADVARILQAFEDEADGVVAAARADAERVRTEAERRESRIRAELPDRLAKAGAETTGNRNELGDDERSRLEADTAQTVERLRQTARDMTPATVDAVIDVIWAQLGQSGAVDREDPS